MVASTRPDAFSSLARGAAGWHHSRVRIGAARATGMTRMAGCLSVALVLGVGLGLPTQPALIAKIPELLRPLFESGISAGGLTAIALNAIWWERRQGCRFGT